MFDATVVDDMGPGPELAQVLLSVEPDTLDTRQSLCWLRAWERFEANAEARRYQMLGHYADLHPALDDAQARSGEETSTAPGGAGTPCMTEFAVTDLAVATGCTSGRADNSIGDALDLRHRMPVLFARLTAGEVPGFKVRMILRAAAGLSSRRPAGWTSGWRRSRTRSVPNGWTRRSRGSCCRSTPARHSGAPRAPERPGG